MEDPFSMTSTPGDPSLQLSLPMKLPKQWEVSTAWVRGGFLEPVQRDAPEAALSTYFQVAKACLGHLIWDALPLQYKNALREDRQGLSSFPVPVGFRQDTFSGR